MCLLSVLRDLWRSRSFDIGDTQWLACEQRTVNTVITTSITTESIILFIIDCCCCFCCCWHLFFRLCCCMALATVGHPMPHLLQVRHHTVDKGLDVVVAVRPCSERCMDLLCELVEDLPRIGLAKCLEERCFCDVIVALELFFLLFFVSLGD